MAELCLCDTCKRISSLIVRSVSCGKQIVWFTMENKLNLKLNHRDKEYLKMAMLKHEETFKQQVYELHRLYRIQKVMMKEASKNARNNDSRACSRAKARLCLEDDDESNLELTLGPRSYYQKERAFESDSGPGFSTSSTESGRRKGIARGGAVKRDEFSGQPASCGPEMPVLNGANQDRLNSPPWLFRALSLNVT